MKKKVLLNVLVCLMLAAPAYAASKSATVRVSCTVPALVQLSAPSPERPVKAASNLGTQYQMTEDLRDESGRKIKLYSLTVL